MSSFLNKHAIINDNSTKEALKNVTRNKHLRMEVSKREFLITLNKNVIRNDLSRREWPKRSFLSIFKYECT